jgi:hypothetical protein
MIRIPAGATIEDVKNNLLVIPSIELVLIDFGVSFDFFKQGIKDFSIPFPYDGICRGGAPEFTKLCKSR